MQVLSIPYSDDLLVATGKSKDALEQELRFLLAVKLFELRRLSLGKAAQLCGMPKLNFMDEIGRMGTPVINLDDDQIRDELQNAWFGTIGLLLRAKRRGLIETIKPHIDALIENGIYIRRELINAVLKDAGE